ncbi:hypothetical protein EJB05_05877, partial [Eragrostis curvula]
MVMRGSSSPEIAVLAPEPPQVHPCQASSSGPIEQPCGAPKQWIKDGRGSTAMDGTEPPSQRARRDEVPCTTGVAQTRSLLSKRCRARPGNRSSNILRRLCPRRALHRGPEIDRNRDEAAALGIGMGNGRVEGGGGSCGDGCDANWIGFSYSMGSMDNLPTSGDQRGSGDNGSFKRGSRNAKADKKTVADDVKAAASERFLKAKAAALVGAEKVKFGTSRGIEWVKEQYQKRASK